MAKVFVHQKDTVSEDMVGLFLHSNNALGGSSLVAHDGELVFFLVTAVPLEWQEIKDLIRDDQFDAGMEEASIESSIDNLVWLTFEALESGPETIKDFLTHE